MGVKRFLLIAVLAVAASVVFVPGAIAGDFDPARMGCTGDDPATCPTGQVGKPYSLSVRLVGDQDTGCAVLRVSSGSLPPGLSITQNFNESNQAIISGTPTAAGTASFYLSVDYNAQPGCLKSSSDNQFIININPEVPRLILQPEQAGVPISTVGSQFNLQMTSNLPDAKSWTLSGQLPPGVNLDSASGLISGIPTTAGTYSFTVSAVLNPDPLQNPARSDTKALQVVVRPALVITAGEPWAAGAATRWEVGIPFQGTFTATGGNDTYTWALASGTLPSGVTFDATTGSISGTPRVAGISRFSITATDGEGRVATYNATLSVAAKLAITRQPLAPAKAGKLYRTRFRTTGGVAPVRWRITAGPLPRGMRLDRATGVLAGKPTKAGRYRITVEVVDELGAKSTRSYLLIVRAAPAKKR